MFYHPYYMTCPYQRFPYRPDYPAVDPKIFLDSAKEANGLLSDGQLILNKLLATPEIARKIMAAAQNAQKETVISLLRQTGVHNHLDTSFNPDGIRIILSNSQCKLFLVLRWT
ncbi:hypothetical protein [Bacillus changyiensis]|uniref:hypothetical protein n=1 Tax=Bacillus changyiensis TaxID=3004103 RepID=UPI0022E80981|nr:hypothetical protein [Bacillus changyiensis]MDA1476252.1 hypothetical protein [Bacillus changyiensis]